MLTYKRNLIVYSVLLFIFYLSWVSLNPRNIFWSLDEGGKYIYLQSILKTEKLNTELIYPARKIDPNLQYIPLFYFIRKGDAIYSWWPIALPLVSLLFYKIFGWLGLFILPAGAGALVAGMTGYLAQKLTSSMKVGIITVLITGIATPIAFYSTRFWEHTLSVAGVIGALIGILDADEVGNKYSAVLAGVSASLAIYFRLEVSIILAACILVFFLRRPNLAFITALTSVLVSIPWVALNLWTMGYPFSPTLNKLIDAEAYAGWQQAGIKLFAYILFNPPRADCFILPHLTMGIAIFSLILGLLLAFFPKLRMFSATSLGVTIAICAWVVYQPSWYQAVHGAILVAPQVLFGIYYLLNRNAWKQTMFPAILLISICLYGAVYLWRAWIGAGGLQWGPRYLLAFYPFLIVAGVVELYSTYKLGEFRLYSILLIIFGFACIVGLSFSLRGLWTAHRLTEYYERSKVYIYNLDAPIDIEWQGYVMDVPDLYLSGKVVTIPTSNLLRNQWEAYIKKIGYDHYFSVYLLTVDNAPLEIIAERLLENPSGILLKRIDLK